MKSFATMLLLLSVVVGTAFGQPFIQTAAHDVVLTKANWTGPDSTKPYLNDQGVRTVWVTNDLDKDGKPEILATDYSNNGRVHVFELVDGNKVELVWSSPRHQPSGGGSTPRWVRHGDLDGDGNGEIIFPWALTGGADTSVVVFEWTGADNDYGIEPAIELTKNLFAPQGLGNFRMNRETGEVYDFDSDGRDELITCNRDGKVYVMGVVGEFPGFASWQIEGGDPLVHPDNRFSAGSWWHSFPADIDGDGTKEIVNHYWNYWGMWSIDPLGPDAYRYPTPSVDSLTDDRAKTDFYHEFYPEDACSYMGMVPLDVDGDGKQELAGIVYVGGSDNDYDAVLISLTQADTGVYVWRGEGQFATIGHKMWELAGKTGGSHWGSAAYDFNGNGRDEYVVGGAGGYELISLEYKGTGNILDAANYDRTITFPGEATFFHYFDIYDSLGTITDTVSRENPFLAKVFAGCDLDNNGKKEAVMAYQSVADSITYTYYSWDTTAVPQRYVASDTVKIPNSQSWNIKVVEWTGAVFVDKPLQFVTPEDYVLEQNYPNPFNPSTTIRFSLPVNKNISLTVYDMVGREVKKLIGDEVYTPGVHTAEWDGTDNLGKPVASGNYVYTLKFGNFTKSAKMMLLK
jgi:hypothetical protein